MYVNKLICDFQPHQQSLAVYHFSFLLQLKRDLFVSKKLVIGFTYWLTMVEMVSSFLGFTKFILLTFLIYCVYCIHNQYKPVQIK